MVRGERASEEGDHSRAVSLFERAAITFETTGDPLFAADAYLELGLALLYLHRSDEIPALAPRVSRLASTPAPILGSILLIRVLASILRQAPEKPGPFVDMVDRRRRLRFPAAAAPENPPTTLPSTPAAAAPGLPPTSLPSVESAS